MGVISKRLQYSGEDDATEVCQRLFCRIIDEDKRQVSYVKEFSEIARTPSLRLKKHGSKSHYLIMVSPAMDGFLLKCAEELGISMEEYGYTSCLKEFTSITKSVTSKNDSAFKKLFKALDNASERLF